MQCNIDRRGQIVRLTGGLAFIMAGLVTGMFAYAATGPAWLYAVAAVLLGSGAFAVFEARKKWCAVRAMGFRTPI